MGRYTHLKEEDPWIVLNEPYSESNIAGIIRNAHLLTDDIDDCVGPSPAKEIAFGKLKEPAYLVNPKFLLWCGLTGFKLATKGKSAESETWKQFIEYFLRDPAELRKITSEYTRESIPERLYPNVQRFYGLLPNGMTKIFLSRNIAPVCDAYGLALGFSDVWAEQFDKKTSIERVMSLYPECKSYLVKGDSEEDAEVLDVLHHAERQNRIDGVLGIYIAGNPDLMNRKFDVNIGRNYGKLVSLLKTT